MAIELKAGLAHDQRLEQRLALDERQPRDIPAVEMQEIEGVIDECTPRSPSVAAWVLGEARQSGIVDATKLAVDIGGLHVHVREGRDGARIFVSPVEPSPGQKLHTAIVDARGHAIAVELDLMHPLRPRGRLLDGLGKLRRDELRKGDAPARPTGLDGLRGGNFTTRDMLELNRNCRTPTQLSRIRSCFWRASDAHREEQDL